MKIQKIVSLDYETAPIAKSMSNFSGWVRTQLKLYDEGFDLVEVEEKRLLWYKVAQAFAEQSGFEDVQKELYEMVKKIKEENQ